MKTRLGKCNILFLAIEYADVLDSQDNLDDVDDLSDRDTLNHDNRDDHISNGIDTSTGEQRILK